MKNVTPEPKRHFFCKNNVAYDKSIFRLAKCRKAYLKREIIIKLAFTLKFFLGI